MKHINRTLFLLLILTLCLTMLLTSCIRLRKRTDTAQSETKPVTEAEEEEYLPETTLNTGTATKPADTEKTLETDEDGNRILQTVAGKTPQELYAKTQEKLENMAEYEISIKGNVFVSADGIDTNIRIKQDICKESNEAYCKMDMAGEVVEAWYMDGLFYERYDNGTDTETKLVMPNWTMDAFLQQNAATLEIGADWVDKADVRSQKNYFLWDDTHYLWEGYLSADKAKAFCVQETYGTPKQASVSISLKFNILGVLESYTLEQEATFDYQNKEITMKMYAEFDVLGINKTVSEVALPADADQYIYYDGK